MQRCYLSYAFLYIQQSKLIESNRISIWFHSRLWEDQCVKEANKSGERNLPLERKREEIQEASRKSNKPTEAKILGPVLAQLCFQVFPIEFGSHNFLEHSHYLLRSPGLVQRCILASRCIDYGVNWFRLGINGCIPPCILHSAFHFAECSSRMQECRMQGGFFENTCILHSASIMKDSW